MAPVLVPCWIQFSLLRKWFRWRWFGSSLFLTNRRSRLHCRWLPTFVPDPHLGPVGSKSNNSSSWKSRGSCNVNLPFFYLLLIFPLCRFLWASNSIRSSCASMFHVSSQLERLLCRDLLWGDLLLMLLCYPTVFISQGCCTSCNQVSPLFTSVKYLLFKVQCSLLHIMEALVHQALILLPQQNSILLISWKTCSEIKMRWTFLHMYKISVDVSPLAVLK